MMLSALSASGLVLSTVLIGAGQSAGPNPIGAWTREDGGTRIQIEPCGTNLCAINTWVRDPQGSEKVGDTLVLTLVPASPSVLKGKAYDQRRQMTYSMTMTFDPEGMKTHGCVVFGLVCKTAEWTRGQ
jgi:uncharacterized protein (DUF2147 family)